MTQVSPVTIASPQFAGNTLQQNGRSRTDNAATGVGMAGATATFASNKAAKNGVFAKFGTAGAKAGQMTQDTINKLKFASENVGKFKKLGIMFKIKKAEFVEDFMKMTSKFQGNKYVKAVMNNKITKKCGAAFGGVMAFFVLVPSVLSMVNMIDDISQR